MHTIWCPARQLAYSGPSPWQHDYVFLLLQLSKAERHRDLIAISVVHTLNAALCEFHMANCPPSEQLTSECSKVKAVYEATKKAVRELDVEMSCIDQLVSSFGDD